MNQLTKCVVIASTLVAALVELYLATRLIYPQLFTIVLAGGVAAAVAGTRWPGPVSAAILVTVYLTPTAYVMWPGFENYGLEIVWALPLLGLAVSGSDGWRWNLPARWRWPLVAWALVIAASWPIVFLREIDFDPSILPRPRVSNTSIGISPWESGLGVSYWMLVQCLGLLWFDRLFGWYSNGGLDQFRARVVVPLAAALSLACAVGIYQGFVDLGFLNPHDWPHLRRASGTFGDANAFGVIAALWAPAFIVIARAFSRPWSMIAGVTGVALAALGVFTSGSRTGLILMSIGLAAVVYESVTVWRTSQGRSGPVAKRLAPMIVAGIVLSAVALLAVRSASITSVVSRGSLGYIPIVGDLGIRESARQLLWERYGYGPAAVQMIKEHPWAGVGVGSFHTLVHDFAAATSGKFIPPDNAQSWYRHMLAELGILGSLPWIAWCLIFVSTLFSRWTSHRDRFAAGILRGSLVGFGVISLLGAPGQSLPVTLTFWTLAFWFVSLKGMPATLEEPPDGAWSTTTWGATLALVAVHSVITFADARGDLLPRNRSMRFGWDYRYGISDPERNSDGTPDRRWTDLESLSVIPVRGKVLKFVGWIDHPDADERPVHVRVWADSKIVYDGDLKRSAAIFLDIPASPGKTHMVVETEISRMWKPRDFGRNDPRELGLSIRDWTWE